MAVVSAEKMTGMVMVVNVLKMIVIMVQSIMCTERFSSWGKTDDKNRA